MNDKAIETYTSTTGEAIEPPQPNRVIMNRNGEMEFIYDPTYPR